MVEALVDTHIAHPEFFRGSAWAKASASWSRMFNPDDRTKRRISRVELLPKQLEWKWRWLKKKVRNAYTETEISRPDFWKSYKATITQGQKSNDNALGSESTQSDIMEVQNFDDDEDHQHQPETATAALSPQQPSRVLDDSSAHVDYAAEILELTRNLRNSHEENASLLSDIACTNEQNTHFKTQIDALKAEIDAQKKDMDVQRAQINYQRKSVEDMDRQYKTLQAEVTRILTAMQAPAKDLIKNMDAGELTYDEGSTVSADGTRQDLKRASMQR
ncbi:hypothetical protein BDK51DRAFT_48652 [Blyttiomyces helicus]|uniref:Uncharacterized protein n=1 Tax=Blyttiomyces helicus TaxID=388810 RepID=A0A4P9VXK8_9FUNG|nr:hypothetical protein BDK51DRAFT_48652 [Blyttiomyces helicus]|eukprot:RKO84481.1 hypothetical protein BDK51DRAFT_48652 [Blyttiomyces helicus]